MGALSKIEGPINWDWFSQKFDKIKLGGGLVGKALSLGLAFVLLCTVAVWALKDQHPMYIMTALILSFVLVLVLSIGAAWYSTKHPNHAALSGAELVRIAELSQNAADPKIIDLNADPTSANTAPPSQITGDNSDGV